MTGTNPLHLNPLNFSPIGNKCQNGEKNLEDQYSMSSSLICAFLILWVESNAHIQLRTNEEIHTILRIHKMHQKDIMIWA